MKKIFSLSDLAEEIETKRKGKKVVFTNGCFDLLHVGHIRYLQEARALGDYLILGLNSDNSVKKLKGPERPVQVQDDRAEILAALECISFVTIFDEPTPLNLIETLRPDILVKGGDWPVEKIVGSDFVLKNGGDVKSLPFHKGRSTTGIIDKILKTT